jgi:MFS family permease
MENLDATVITPAIPQMAASFAVRPVDLNTGVSAYMLTLGVFIPVSGWVADRFGARKVFATAIAVFTIASLLCGLAGTLSVFVLVRILQGIGGAMMVPVGRLVALRVTPKEQLIRAIATLTWPAPVAPVLGPPLGGLIAEHADWRWIFYLNLPLGLIAFVVALLLVPNTKGELEQPFDWEGFVLVGRRVVLSALARRAARAAADCLGLGGRSCSRRHRSTELRRAPSEAIGASDGRSFRARGTDFRRHGLGRFFVSNGCERHPVPVAGDVPDRFRL